jgi:hypothetical protein
MAIHTIIMWVRQLSHGNEGAVTEIYFMPGMKGFRKAFSSWNKLQ